MKIISALEAAKLVRDGDSITTEGFLNSVYPEKLVSTLENLFLETGHPKDLILCLGGGKGTGGWENLGLNHFAHEGFIKRFMGSHTGVCRKLEQMVADNKIPGYTYPQGIAGAIFRAAGAGQPGILSKIGIGTFIDPRVGEGGKMNALAFEEDYEVVRVMTIDGEDYLYYRTHPIHVAFLRGTTADENGNISIEKEALNLDLLPIAQATKATGGKVFFQVERICATGTLHPRAVKIPGVLVDYVIVSEPEYHQQTLTYSYNPAYTGEIRVPVRESTEKKDEQVTVKKIIQRRAAFELKGLKGVLNLGIGSSDGVVAAARELGIKHELISTCESGTINGVPATGLDFGAATNPEAIIDMVDMFSIYNGYGLDFTALGMGQADQYGNVNTTKFGSRAPGPGGFIDISQSARKAVFVGAFTAGKLEVKVEDGQLKIIQEGNIRKFVKQVEQISFSGTEATRNKQDVWYVTERAVFHLEEGKMVLMEIAPGIDLEKQILALMDFKPIVSPNLRVMDQSIFK
ncbi:MAG TPA: acyl CoA:acetate/3-ketoacid CoA transferase [Firmicutes bacterium]|nr:acyl CoA:acetate/3-ketoacid CoA transferase [Bacillota bacterium]